MTDLDKAREEYKHALRSTYVSRDADECGRTYGLVDEDKADAIIAALQAEVERVNRIVVSQSQQLGNTRSQREHELIEALDSTQADADTQFKLRAQAEAERALRDRMIRISFEDAYPMHGDTYDSGGIYRKWLADLRARAEQNPQHLSTSSDVSITPLHNLKRERDELLAEVERLKSDLRFITNYTTSERERKALKRAEAAEAKVLQLGIEKDAEEYRANVAEAERDRLMDAQARANAVIDVARRMASYRKRGGPRPLWNEFREELARYDACHFTPSRWQRRES